MQHSSRSPSTDSPHATDEAYPIRIRADGSWWHEGAPMVRAGLVALFASALQRDKAGGYWLITPAERGRIVVDDAPLIVASLAELPGDRLEAQLATGVTVPLDAAHPLRLGGSDGTRPRLLYLAVGPGQGGYPVEAKFSRSAWMQAALLARPDGLGGLDLHSAGSAWRIGEDVDG